MSDLYLACFVDQLLRALASFVAACLVVVAGCSLLIRAACIARSLYLSSISFLSVSVLACLFAFLQPSLSVCLSACRLLSRLPACLPVCSPVCLSVCLSVCLPVCLSVCLSECLSASVFLSLFPSVCACLSLSVACLSIYLFVGLFACFKRCYVWSHCVLPDWGFPHGFGQKAALFLLLKCRHEPVWTCANS